MDGLTFGLGSNGILPRFLFGLRCSQQRIEGTTQKEQPSFTILSSCSSMLSNLWLQLFQLLDRLQQNSHCAQAVMNSTFATFAKYLGSPYIYLPYLEQRYQAMPPQSTPGLMRFGVLGFAFGSPNLQPHWGYIRGNIRVILGLYWDSIGVIVNPIEPIGGNM